MVDFSRAARTIANECLGMRVRKASRVLTRVLDAALRPLGVQASQLPVLVAVAMFGEEGVPIGPLARALGMDRTTLTRNVRPLEKAGLLRVARSPDDARARIVLLTRAGERLIEEAYPLWERVQADMREALGKKTMDRLRVQLGEVVEHASKLEDAGGDETEGDE
jgi:DNA-binding MarR family transcriptional regulator